MLCPHCSHSFRADRVAAQRGKGLASQIQCPHCDAWLGKSAILMRLKILGFYLGLSMLLVGYFMPEWRNLTTAVAIFSAMILLVSHMMDHLKVMQAPPQKVVDDSEHRRKYR
ncbi:MULTISPECIES: hypothetical protein [Shewanella]|uniref:Uncharacterized protein n=1 Tax=Shewanella marisflavi TaxID=260364 RepID=A0AAC9XME9_9GAMM|nr:MULTISPECIES: hypothetical protein [Shewanella]ASJ95484.1 hypothetical protein CFF01_02170 [Shewanella marisflavi]MCL1042846.1 hypothetical protein [Shewanella marisflavi]QDF74037.1 hypothetical protein FGA12_02050 [Shewanella marisflavi]